MNDDEHWSASVSLSASSPFGMKLAVLALVGALLLLDLGVAAARGAAFGRLDAIVGVSAGLVLALMLWGGTTRGGRRFFAHSGDTVAYVMVSLLGAWLAAEIIVAGYVYTQAGVNPFTAAPPFHTRPPRQHLTFIPDEASFPGITGVSHYTTNSAGLRGPEFPPRTEAYRILTIGGSTTECTYLDDTETWQHLLSQRLNQETERRPIWVGSAGISGFPTVNHIQFVANSPLMQQVDALTFLVGANDFNQFLRGNLRDGVFMPNEAVDIRPLWRYSPIVAMVRERWNRRESALDAEDSVGRNIPRRRLLRHTATTRDAVPGLERALQQYQTRVETLVELARGHGLRPIFITQPTLWDEALDERTRALLSYGDISATEYLSVEAGRAAIDRHNEVLMGVCANRGVECISTAFMNGQERFFYDDFHYNEAGAAALARIIADHFITHATAADWNPRTH